VDTKKKENRSITGDQTSGEIAMRGATHIPIVKHLKEPFDLDPRLNSP
jgi:hypothetical protein